MWIPSPLPFNYPVLKEMKAESVMLYRWVGVHLMIRFLHDSLTQHSHVLRQITLRFSL